MNTFLELVRKNRSYRRFYEEVRPTRAQLERMIEAARLSPSAANRQPLRYIICDSDALCARVFETLAWAGYLKDWPGPEPGERPSAYFIQLHDTERSSHYLCDHGIAAQSILLQAVDEGFGGCILASVKRDALRIALHIAPQYEIIQVIAIGKPKEKVIIEPFTTDCKYWRDNAGVHHVPKRSLEDLIL